MGVRSISWPSTKCLVPRSRRGVRRPHVAHGGVVEWLDLPKNQLLQEEVGVHTEDAEEACEASCDMTKSAVDLLETEAIVSSTWVRRGEGHS